MDARDIKTHVSNLDKALKEKAPAATIIDILSSLKKGVVATESVLRETKVGVAVNRCRLHEDKAVAQLTKEIIMKWKNDVKKPTAAKSHGSKDSPPTSIKSPSKSSASASSASLHRKFTGDIDSRTKDKDGVNYRIYGDGRDNVIGMFYDGLVFKSDAAPQLILNKAIATEKAVFGQFKKLDSNYKSKARSIFLNLKDKKNSSLRERVISGEISPERLATMTNAELASKDLQQEMKAIQEENLKNSMVGKPEKSVTDQLTCSRCRQKRVSYTQAQTRSADEPLTTFCECENCGHRWKFS